MSSRYLRVGVCRDISGWPRDGYMGGREALVVIFCFDLFRWGLKGWDGGVRVLVLSCVVGHVLRTELGEEIGGGGGGEGHVCKRTFLPSDPFVLCSLEARLVSFIFISIT